MKRFFSFLIVAVSALFVAPSCEKEDEWSGGTSSTIVSRIEISREGLSYSIDFTYDSAGRVSTMSVVDSTTEGATKKLTCKYSDDEFTISTGGIVVDRYSYENDYIISWVSAYEDSSIYQYANGKVASYEQSGYTYNYEWNGENISSHPYNATTAMHYSERYNNYTIDINSFVLSMYNLGSIYDYATLIKRLPAYSINLLDGVSHENGRDIAFEYKFEDKSFTIDLLDDSQTAYVVTVQLQ
ncbi:MAG: hypothetical protein SNH79_00560 [Rikenellaceae bacterium]